MRIISNVKTEQIRPLNRVNELDSHLIIDKELPYVNSAIRYRNNHYLYFLRWHLSSRCSNNRSRAGSGFWKTNSCWTFIHFSFTRFSKIKKNVKMTLKEKWSGCLLMIDRIDSGHCQFANLGKPNLYRSHPLAVTIKWVYYSKE